MGNVIDVFDHYLKVNLATSADRFAFFDCCKFGSDSAV